MQSTEELLPLVYEELRQLAAEKLARESPGMTLQPTALVHEAYLRLERYRCSASWWGRGAFYAAAAEAMRRILVDRARQRRALKSGGQRGRLPLTDSTVAVDDTSIDLVELDEVLSDLQQNEPIAAELVKLRFFAGFTHQEAADVLQIERRVADRLWTLARAWLYRQLSTKS